MYSIFKYLKQIKTHDVPIPWWLSGKKKKSTCDAGNTGSIPEWQEIPCRRKWQPTPVFLPGKSHDQAWWATKVHRVMKELDTT